MGGAASSASSIEVYAGLTREMETVSFCRPGIAILKFTLFLLTTLYGPV